MEFMAQVCLQPTTVLILQEPFCPATCQNGQLRKEKALVLLSPGISKTTLPTNRVLLEFYLHWLAYDGPVFTSSLCEPTSASRHLRPNVQLTPELEP